MRVGPEMVILWGHFTWPPGFRSFRHKFWSYSIEKLPAVRSSHAWIGERVEMSGGDWSLAFEFIPKWAKRDVELLIWLADGACGIWLAWRMHNWGCWVSDTSLIIKFCVSSERSRRLKPSSIHVHKLRSTLALFPCWEQSILGAFTITRGVWAEQATCCEAQTCAVYWGPTRYSHSIFRLFCSLLRFSM